MFLWATDLYLHKTFPEPKLTDQWTSFPLKCLLGDADWAEMCVLSSSTLVPDTTVYRMRKFIWQPARSECGPSDFIFRATIVTLADPPAVPLNLQ